MDTGVNKNAGILITPKGVGYVNARMSGIKQNVFEKFWEGFQRDIKQIYGIDLSNIPKGKGTKQRLP